MFYRYFDHTLEKKPKKTVKKAQFVIYLNAHQMNGLITRFAHQSIKQKFDIIVGEGDSGAKKRRGAFFTENVIKSKICVKVFKDEGFVGPSNVNSVLLKSIEP